MKIGVVVPQGWVLEYRGWDGPAAWERTVAVAGEAERLGFESVVDVRPLPPLAPAARTRSASSRSWRSPRWRR